MTRLQVNKMRPGNTCFLKCPHQRAKVIEVDISRRVITFSIDPEWRSEEDLNGIVQLTFDEVIEVVQPSS